MKSINRHLIKILILFCISSLFLVSGVLAAPRDFYNEEIPPNLPNSPNGDFQLFLPLVRHDNNRDLWVANLEITQGIQSLSNDVPLVAGRATAVRVYIQANGFEPSENASVTISGKRGGIDLANSPLVAGPATIPTSWSRDDINASFNFDLPASWLSGNVSLNVTVSSLNGSVESNSANNSISQNIIFNDVAPLNITVVPIQYNDPYYGYFAPPNPDYLAEDLLELYPLSQINLTSHPYITFNKDLSDTYYWELLLDRITYLKNTEGKPDSEVYYGLIPMKNSYGGTWWYGGTIGLGWVGYRAAIGLTNYDQYGIDGGDTAAHEIGHNFGRWHSPCGNPGNVDPSYPYSNGTIGEFGFKVSNFKVIPNSRYDIMSYCDPMWVSDYTYKGLLENQISVAAASERMAKQSQQEVLLIRAKFDQDNEIKLNPVYSLTGRPSNVLEDSQYQVEFLDADGKVIASQGVEILLAEGDEISMQAINARIPIPEFPFASIRLVKDGKTLAEQILHPSSPDIKSQVQLSLENDNNTLQWGYPDIPALLRYSSDGGRTYTTLDIDILGGEIDLDPNHLPEGSLVFQIILADQNSTKINITWDNEG
jgi:hypothetical protein